MEAESRLSTAFDLEREWWDKKSQTMIYAKASKKGMIDYIDNLNRFLHEGTGDKTHATKIGTELLSIQASTAEESSPESIQSRLDTLRQRMWKGYGFPTDADATKLILDEVQRDPTLPDDDILLDVSAPSHSMRPSEPKPDSNAETAESK